MRRRIFYRWLFYSLATFLFLFLQNVLLNHLVVHGIHPFLLPALVAIAATLESRREGFLFAAALGLLLDLAIPAAIPCFYLLSLCLCALLSSLVSRRLIVPGFICSMVCATGATVLCSLLSAFFYNYFHSIPLLLTGKIALIELLLSLLFFLPVHGLYFVIHRRFSRN